MIQCNKCGQGNAFESNFCRFCGNRLLQPQQNNIIPQNGNGGSYEVSPPRPYVWKTDEFQINDSTSARKTEQINRVEPLTDLNKTAMLHQQPQQMMNNFPPPQPQHLAHQQQTNMAFGYRCPRCATQLLPRIVRKISPVGWVLFAVLLIAFFPLFWIGFLIKEDTRVCPVCNLRVS